MDNFPTKEKIKAAAKAAGWNTIDLENLIRCAEVGEIIQESGLVYLGLTIYGGSKTVTDKALDLAGRALDACDPENHEVVVALTAATAKIVHVNNEIAEGIIKSIHNSAPNKKPAPKGLPPGSKFQASQNPQPA